MLLKKIRRRKKENERLPQPRTDSRYFSGGEEKKWRGKLMGTYSPVMNQKTAENLGITNMIRCFLSQM